MNRYFTRLCSEAISFHTDNVTDVQQLFKYGIVKGLVLTGAKIVTAEVDLDTARFILQFDEGCTPHHADRHDPAGDRDIAVVTFMAFVVFQDFLRGSVYFKKFCRIGIDAHFLELFFLFPADDLLFTELPT